MFEAYVYDGNGTRLSRQIGGGAPIGYVSDVNRPLPDTMDDGTRKYVYGPGLAYAVSGATVDVYHTDRLGSVRSITSGSGVVTAAFRSDEWGNGTAQAGSSSQPFGFTGEPLDATGLSYLRARYYDPSIGRLMSRDPWPGSITACQTLNRYAYALDNPASRNDPSGLKPQVLGGPGIDLSGLLPCDAFEFLWSSALLAFSTADIIAAASEVGFTFGAAAPVATFQVAAGLAGASAAGVGIWNSYHCPVLTP